VVEAYAHTHDLLPHLHKELEDLFPRAVAREEEEEGEDATPCGFESRGETWGKAVHTTKTAPTTAATTKTATTTAATTTTTTTTTTVEPQVEARKRTAAATLEKRKKSVDLRRG